MILKQYRNLRRQITKRAHFPRESQAVDMEYVRGEVPELMLERNAALLVSRAPARAGATKWNATPDRWIRPGTMLAWITVTRAHRWLRRQRQYVGERMPLIK